VLVQHLTRDRRTEPVSRNFRFRRQIVSVAGFFNGFEVRIGTLDSGDEPEVADLNSTLQNRLSLLLIFRENELAPGQPRQPILMFHVKQEHIKVEDHPGACIIKLTTAVIYGFRNKLKCLSLASISSLDQCLGPNTLAYYRHRKLRP
jgi:hypothetical protein